jgi:hypothetical protein
MSYFFGVKSWQSIKKFQFFGKFDKILSLFLDQIATCMFKGYCLIDLAKKCCKFKQILIESI